jgi:hypothetical protein
MIEFLFYLLRHGRLKINIPDFDTEFKKVIATIPAPITDPGNAGVYVRLRKRLMRIPRINTIVSNIAYIKSARKLNNQFFFVDKSSLAYVRILKSASTSVLSQLLPMIDNRLVNVKLTDEQIDVLAMKYARQAITPGEKNYTYFTIVRDPFRRLVSVYLDLFNAHNAHFAYADYLFGILKYNMTFSEFVLTLSKIPDALKAPHFALQSHIIENLGDEISIKYFRLEKDGAELSEFLEQHGIHLPHVNRHKKTYDYRDFYSPETAKLVYKIYKGDVEKYGYQNDYKNLLEYLDTKP